MELPALEITGLEVGYGGAITGLAELTMTIPAGGIVGLLGANGAGKTTTLKAISNLLPFEGGRVRRGSIRFFGQEIAGVPAHILARRGLLHVREGRHVFADMTVDENLVAATFALAGRGRPNYDDVYDAFPSLARRRHGYAGYLSGGEQQMLAIGRALVAEPRLLLIDEASLGLAPLIAEQIFSVIHRIKDTRGISVLIVEQNAALALRHVDHCYVLESGRCLLEGPSHELRDDPAMVARYLGGAAPAIAVPVA